MKLIQPKVDALEHWLMLPETVQFKSLASADSSYTALLECFVSYDANDSSKQDSILTFAAQKGYLAIVEHLLEMGSDSRSKNALHYAGKAGHTDIVRALIRAGAPLNLQDSDMFKHVAIIQILQEEGALAQKDLPHALFVAAQQGNLEAVELLISTGARLNRRNAEGLTALMLAAKYGKTAVVNALINAGAKQYKADSQGNTAIHLAIAANNHELVQIFLQARLKLNRPQHDLTKALQIATQYGYGNLIPILIQAGADPNVRSDTGTSCLLWAVRNKKLEIVNTLLKVRADPQLADHHGFTPLMEAAWFSDRGLIRHLIIAGAQVNAVNIHGSTALMWAIEKGDYATVKTLIMAGSDLTIINRYRETPFSWAHRCQQAHLIPLLRGGLIRQFYLRLITCDMNEVQDIIDSHRRAGISKKEIYQYMLSTESDLDRKIELLQRATAINAQGRPNNPLSKFMHQSQGCGFRTFFSGEPSYAISRIKTELIKLQEEKAKLAVDMAPKFG